MVMIYHATNQESAENIREGDFQNPQVVGGYIPTEEGIYFSDRSLAGDESLDENTTCYFQIEIPEEIIVKYEVNDAASQKADYREWNIPAEVVNEYFTDRTIYFIAKD